MENSPNVGVVEHRENVTSPGRTTEAALKIFMNNDNFEQISININMIGNQSAFLQDGMNVIINIYNDEPVSVVMPDSCIEEIIEADAVIKGQTVSSSFKPAILKNGVKVMVPGHIEVGTKIVVKPSDSTYIEKAKI